MVFDPVSAAILGGTTLASGIMGANAQKDAAMQNQFANLMNLYMRDQERREAMQVAERNRADQKLGSTNSYGDRTRFVEGVGWVTDLSPESQGLQDMQRAEQRAVLSEDIPRRRRQERINEQRRGEDEYTAGGLRNEFRNIVRMRPDQMEGLLYNASTRGINEGFDATQSKAMRDAIRSGASNTGSILADLARARSKAFSDASVDARLRSRQMADAEFDNQRKQAANLYNMFATRAGASPDVSFKPENLDDEASRLALAKLVQGAGDNEFKAATMSQGNIDYVQPQYGMSNTVANLGKVIGSEYSTGKMQDLYAQNMNRYYDYLRSGQNTGNF